MSTLRTIGGYAKWIAVLFIRLQILAVGLYGVYGALTDHWAVGALLLVPALYFGRFVWRGYRDDSTQPKKKVAD